MACLMSRKACAAYLGVSLRTVRYWDAGRHQVPWAVVRLLRFVRLGDLGALEPAWAGFVLNRRGLFSPDGRCFPVEALRCWWQTVEQARFWRDDYDRKVRARMTAHATVGSQASSALPQTADGGAVDLVSVAGDEAQAVGRDVVRGPAPSATVKNASSELRAAAPARAMTTGADLPTREYREAVGPHGRFSAPPAAGLPGSWVASRYARRRRAARSAAGLVSFLKQVRREEECRSFYGVNLTSKRYHMSTDVCLEMRG